MRPLNTICKILLLLLCCIAGGATQTAPATHEQNKAQHPNTPAPETAKPAGAEAQPANSSKTTRIDDARIDAIDANLASVTVTDCSANKPSPCNGTVMTLAVESGVRSELKDLHKSDHVTIDTDGKNLLSVSILKIPVAPRYRATVIGIALVLLFLLTVLFTWGHPLKLIIGQDGRYSNSKFQMAIWFWVVLSTYLAVVYLRASQAGWEFLGSVDIPNNLLLLSGMSALTFGGAKGITTAKTNAAIAAGQPNPKDPAGVHENFFKDLVQSVVGAFEIGDFQMLMVTLLAVGMYLALTFNFLGSIAVAASAHLPDVDTTILASFGLGQGAYLTKKAAGNAGTS